MLKYIKAFGVLLASLSVGVAKACDPGFYPDLGSGQCVPLVPNGNILPGPTAGQDAGSYLLYEFLPNLTNSFLIFNLIVAVAVLIIAGFMWIFVSANEELKNRARDAIIWTIVGVVVAILAYFLVQMVINIDFFD